MNEHTLLTEIRNATTQALAAAQQTITPPGENASVKQLSAYVDYRAHMAPIERAERAKAEAITKMVADADALAQQQHHLSQNPGYVRRATPADRAAMNRADKRREQADQVLSRSLFKAGLTPADHRRAQDKGEYLNLIRRDAGPAGVDRVLVLKRQRDGSLIVQKRDGSIASVGRRTGGRKPPR